MRSPDKDWGCECMPITPRVSAGPRALRFRNLRLLTQKEWRELLASRAFWLMLVVIGPLIGHAFINAVDLYAEASGIGGGPSALPQGLTPLDGMLVPTLGAYELAVMLLLPFVAIRLVAGERESGAWKMTAQGPASESVMILAKIGALLIAWMAAWIPGLIALLLWKFYGGHLALAETLNLIFGHWLRMLLATGIAFAAAALTGNASSAAIATLAFTVGTWALDYTAAGHGGIVAALAEFTPAAALRSFEQGLWRANVTLVILTLAATGFVITGIAQQAWLWPAQRRARIAGVVVSALALASAFAFVRWNHDWSENRRNSFSRADEAALKQVRDPLRITIHLSAGDPRLTDYERGVLSKLKLTLPRVETTYAAQSRTGLFEGQQDRYGEIWYELGRSQRMSRSTTPAIVLEELYALAGLAKPADSIEAPYPGYPLAAHPLAEHPQWAAVLFYALWPAAIVLLWWRSSKSL